MRYPGLERSWILGSGRGRGKVMEHKYARRRPGFQHFLVMENLNCSWKKSWKNHLILLPNLCVTLEIQCMAVLYLPTFTLFKNVCSFSF